SRGIEGRRRSMRQSTAMTVAADIADPRVFPDGLDPAFASQIERAAASLASQSVSGAEQHDALLTSDLVRALRAGNGAWLANLLRAAPSAAIARHLWRRLVAAWSEAAGKDGNAVGVTLFAMPIVIVAGQSDEGPASRIEGVLPDSARVRA